ncbi:cobalamin biosynthesis family protein [Photobacterium leiognathi]|uniref:cobalamin biosynthesis family protein n=1 Tax=Photobacterium leiognathi TaxID=553611 RepID=UPI002982651B|nr:cobalamin biosynthesis family protein [Photobacterium leiognathi]
MESLVALLTTNSSLLALWGALLLHWVLPIPYPLHPIVIWQRLALLIAERVNHPKENPSQRILAGSLAWFLMSGTVLILLFAFSQLVWYQTIFQMTLLWMAIDWQTSAKLAKQFNQAYNLEHKGRCRELLADHVNRNTENLSLLGLGKAGAETLLLGYGRNVIGVLFWYAIGGGIAAIMYRLAIGLARTWSPSREQYRFFGLPAIRIALILDIVPLRLFALLITLGQNAKLAFKGLMQQGENWQLPGPGWLLVATGHKLSLSLGGPAMYNQIKMERPRIGGKIAPASLHLAQIQQLMTSRLWCWIIIESGLLILFHGLA